MLWNLYQSMIFVSHSDLGSAFQPSRIATRSLLSSNEQHHERGISPNDEATNSQTVMNLREEELLAIDFSNSGSWTQCAFFRSK
jgi:hypothetical protein